jgi:hypothetical protein
LRIADEVVGLWGNPERRAIKTQDGAFSLRFETRLEVFDCGFESALQ